MTFRIVTPTTSIMTGKLFDKFSWDLDILFHWFGSFWAPGDPSSLWKFNSIGFFQLQGGRRISPDSWGTSRIGTESGLVLYLYCHIMPQRAQRDFRLLTLQTFDQIEMLTGSRQERPCGATFGNMQELNNGALSFQNYPRLRKINTEINRRKHYDYKGRPCIT